MVKTLILMAVAFNIGFLSATHYQKAHYQEGIIKAHQKEVTHLKYVLAQEQNKARQIEEQTKDRMAQLDALNKRNDALLVHVKQLQASLGGAVSNSHDRSVPTTDVSGGRTDTVAELIEQATRLIKERDEIAINYNSLYEQCKVINGSDKK
ncbi:Uncharacterised protein [Anaerobiospirillum thomasii]|uniref:hypothetical protein n=1 Tax=Anaerobiospirillum thomasii TaxID=179995 RepID=UPI000D8F4DE1|nr:hypothetical protein [Anaerobiospirillum thomasii]SPT71498.1 Uncharacterised protein [Anaerobiospirillum thomasii]